MVVETQTNYFAEDETVTVPAGTFERCLITRKMGYAAQSFGIMGEGVVMLTEDAWYCPGVGLVKAIRKEESTHMMIGSGSQSLELVGRRQAPR